MTRLIFWDVDTLCDFMKRDGKLYVAGSEDIIPLVGALTDFAHARHIPIVASADDHDRSHAEIGGVEAVTAADVIARGVLDAYLPAEAL